MELAKSQNTDPLPDFERHFFVTERDTVRRALIPLKNYINALSLDEALFLLTLVRVGRDGMPYNELYTSLKKGFTTVTQIARDITETEALLQCLRRGWDDTVQSIGVD